METRERVALVVAFGLLLAMLTVTAGNAIFGIGGDAAVKPIRDWLSSAVYVLVATIVALRALRIEDRRLSWGIFAAGLSLYGLGNVLWSAWIEHLTNPPIPSICDGLWLSLYPLSYAGILGFANSGGRRRLPAGVWLDGLIAGSGLAGIGAAAVFHHVLASATGSSVAVATELAYPIGDLLLAALVVGVLALRGWQMNRTWTLLGGGFLLLAVADCLYAVQVANGSSDPSPVTNLMYVIGVVLLAFAAWQRAPDQREPRFTGWSVLLVPAASMLAAIGLLVYDHVRRLDPFALGLAILTLLLGVVRMVLTFGDLRGLSETRRREAGTDDLTSLPNRRMFMRRVEEALAACELTGETLSVLVLDLDHFKELNDTLGHTAGDALLRQIGPRIEGALRATDAVARLGGDEFAVLLHPAPGDDGLVRVADKILYGLRKPFEIQALALRVTGSIGMVTYPAHASTADELMKHADIALYRAKAARNRYAFYALEHDNTSRERLALAAELAHALENGDIEVHYQPKADAQSRAIEGVEALVRWRRADGHHLPPSEFIPVAEHTGLSRTLTRRVMELALAQLRVWRDNGHDLYVAINTTVADLLDTGFPREVAAALAAHHLPPDALMLEVTESSVLSDPARIGNVLAQLGEMGVGLSLDDFGTGYSSLAHVKSLPVGEVKIDRSFVARMCLDATDEAIVFAMIQLAGKLGIRVVAEGVEDEQTWQALSALGCQMIQGFLLSRPVPAEQLEEQLNAQPRAHLHGVPTETV